MLLKNFFDKII